MAWMLWHMSGFCAQRHTVCHCMHSSRDKLSFYYAEIQIIFGTLQMGLNDTKIMLSHLILVTLYHY